MAATKKAINQALSQANTVSAAKFIAPLREFVYTHWKAATTKSAAYNRYRSYSQRILKAAYKHDVIGYSGDEQLGRWCPRDWNYTFPAPLRVASGSLSPLPFLYDPVAHKHYLFNVNLQRSQPVGAWAKEWGVNGGDIFSIVFVTVRRELYPKYPEYYNWHPTDQVGVITLRVSGDIRKDKRDIKELMFSDVFMCDNPDYAGNFRFPITQRFGLLQVLNDVDWVYWRQGFGMEAVGAWAIVHSRRSLKNHSSTELRLENHHLYGLDWSNMLNEYL